MKSIKTNVGYIFTFETSFFVLFQIPCYTSIWLVILYRAVFLLYCNILENLYDTWYVISETPSLAIVLLLLWNSYIASTCVRLCSRYILSIYIMLLATPILIHSNNLNYLSVLSELRTTGRLLYFTIIIYYDSILLLYIYNIFCIIYKTSCRWSFEILAYKIKYRMFQSYVRPACFSFFFI